MTLLEEVTKTFFAREPVCCKYLILTTNLCSFISGHYARVGDREGSQTKSRRRCPKTDIARLLQNTLDHLQRGVMIRGLGFYV